MAVEGGPVGTGVPDPAIAATMRLWSCDTNEPVDFYEEHAWLLLRGTIGQEKEEAMLLLRDEGEDSQEARTMSGRSGCTAEVLKLLRDYVGAYVKPDGQIVEGGLWNFLVGAVGATREIALAGCQCWSLLEAGNFLNLDVWPSTGRHADGNQPTHARTHTCRF